MSLVSYTSTPFSYPGGGLAVGVRVRVVFAGTAVNAAIWHDADGTALMTNPVETDNLGQVSFWIEPGAYDLVANGVATTVVVVGSVDPPGANDFITLAQAEALDSAVLLDANAHADTAAAAAQSGATTSAANLAAAAQAGAIAYADTNKAPKPGAWLSPDLTGGTLWTADVSGTYFPAGFRLNGDRLEGSGRLNLAAPNNYVANARICTIPEGARPSRNIVINFRSGGTGAAAGFLEVNASTGVLSFTTAITNASGGCWVHLDALGARAVV